MKHILFYTLGISSAIAANPTAPTALLTNGIVAPDAIDVSPPSFSWVMNDPDRGETQSAWQINPFSPGLRTPP